MVSEKKEPKITMKRANIRRTPLKGSRKPLKRRRKVSKQETFGLKHIRKARRFMLNQESPKMKLIEEIEDLLRAKLKKERGNICQICGKKICRPVGLFHILSKKDYPRLRFHEFNILLAGWFSCHHDFHHNPYKSPAIIERIKELRGKNYEDRLKIIDKGMPKMTMFYLQNKLMSLKMENNIK